MFLTVLLVPVHAQKAKEPQRITSTDAMLRVKGFEKYQEMKRTSPFNNLNWQFVGPRNLTGRITDIAAVTPRGESYTIYIGSAAGGLWKTDNEGVTWKPVFEQGPSTAIGDVAVAPSNPNIVWLGTGEANIYRSSQSGIGVYKSTDAGKTWQHMGLEDTYTIPRIVIHPKNPDIVYVAACGHEWTFNPNRGVYKTTDGGETWTKVLYVDEKTGANDLVMDPSDPETLYATTWQRTRLKWSNPHTFPDHTGSGVWKTIDGGKTWKRLSNGLPEPQHMGRTGIDLCLTKPNVLYVCVVNYEKTRELTPEEVASSERGMWRNIKGATIYRSEDKGETWTQTSGQTPDAQRFSTIWAWNQIRVDPNDENIVYIFGQRFYTSRDGGRTIEVVPIPGVDHHAFWIDPNNSNYRINGNDRGVRISYDKDKTWRAFFNLMPFSLCYYVNYDMDTPFHVFTTIQDHGSFRGIVDLSLGRNKIPTVDFEVIPGGEASIHAIDPTNPNIIYTRGGYGTGYPFPRTDLSKKAKTIPENLQVTPGNFFSPNYPPDWTDWEVNSKTGEACSTSGILLPPPWENEPRLRSQWLAPLIMSPHDPNILFHGTQYLFMSRGNIFTQISPDLTYNDKNEMGDIPYHTIFAISESPLRAGLIYVGTDDGKAHVTKDYGKSWTEIISGLPYKKWVSRIVASAFNMATVYMTQNGKRDEDFTPYVWKSTDYGKTWVSIASNIPYGPVNVIREDPVNRDILYVGTDGGVYVTTDGGKNWTVLGDKLPSVYVHDLIIHPRDNIIVIATHGRGLWALDANSVNKKDQIRSRSFDD
jgi:photosystem II stability/assembly factor-like uncharacterized protein